jgi:dolichol-phosphate mannosyltransferase
VPTPLSIVVPVYQNAGSLPDLVSRIRSACMTIADVDPELVFVDDGSTDGSFETLSALAAVDNRIRVIRLSRNFGSNAAILAGLMHAQGAAVVVIAADLQDPPELIPDLVRHWRAGAEVVLAARRSRDDPLASRVFAELFNGLFRRVVFPDFPPHGFDFVLLDRQVSRTLTAMPEKHSYIFGQIIWLGFRRAILYYDRGSRAHGKSAWTVARKAKYFIDAFTAFTYLPLRLASVVGSLLAVSGLTYAAIIVMLKARGDIAGQGFAALMVALMVTSGTQLLVLGIIGEYLWRVLEEVRPRPPFVVASTINTTTSAAVPPSANRR